MNLFSVFHVYSRSLSTVFRAMWRFNGRYFLLVVSLLTLSAGMQVVSVAMIFPFLSFVATPESIGTTPIGAFLVKTLPTYTNNNLLVLLAAILAVLILVSNILALFSDYIRTRFTWLFVHWLRQHLLETLQNHPYAWFVDQNSSILIKRLTQDIVQLATAIVSPILDGISKTLLSVALSAMIVWTNPELSLTLALVLISSYLLIFTLFLPIRQRISREMQSSWQMVYQLCGQLIEGIKTIKVHDASPHYLKKILGFSIQQANLQSLTPIISNGPKYIIEPLIATTMLVTVVYFLLQGESAAALVPNFGLIAFALYRLLPAVQMLYAHLTNIHTNSYLVDEMFAVADDFSSVSVGESDEITTNLAFEDAININSIFFNYGEKQVLSELSLQVNKNEFIGIIGETGVGKSTLIDILLGLREPSSGYLSIDENVIESKAGWRAWRALVGYVPQDFFIADASIKENIAFGCSLEDIDMERVVAAAEFAQIGDYLITLKDGYNTEVGEHGLKLSGGQRQRIALARAIYSKPKVLILDEATSALDSETEKNFMKVIEELTDRFTIIAVTHRHSILRNADTVYRMTSNGLSKETMY